MAWSPDWIEPQFRGHSDSLGVFVAMSVAAAIALTSFVAVFAAGHPRMAEPSGGLSCESHADRPVVEGSPR